MKKEFCEKFREALQNPFGLFGHFGCAVRNAALVTQTSPPFPSPLPLYTKMNL